MTLIHILYIIGKTLRYGYNYNRCNYRARGFCVYEAFRQADCAMENIFHEKQEGYLCAQHCLNALLQGPYFNAVDLANFGHQMDEEERIRMAESGVDSEDYKLFLEQPSGNMDDSGYFSVQVISSALKVWGLELVPYNSSTEPTALLAQNDPSRMRAYICNYKGHWFTIRKLGNQWFNLNSMLNGPQLISDTYLAMFLAQLLQEGYSIFIVIGTFPQCPAEDILLKNPIVATKSNPNGDDSKSTSKGYRLGTKAEDDILKAALAMGEIEVPQSCLMTRSESILSNKPELSTSKPRERIIPIEIESRDEESDEEEDENVQLARALQMSLQNDEEDVNKTLKLRLDLHTDDSTHLPSSADNADEDDELRRALQLSLECVTAPPTPDPEDIRWRRLNHFNVYTRTPNNEAPAKLNT